MGDETVYLKDILGKLVRHLSDTASRDEIMQAAPQIIQASGLIFEMVKLERSAGIKIAVTQ